MKVSTHLVGLFTCCFQQILKPYNKLLFEKDPQFQKEFALRHGKPHTILFSKHKL